MSHDKSYLVSMLQPHFTDEMYVVETVLEVKF